MKARIDFQTPKQYKDEVCYPGCNVIVTPLLTQTRALSGLDIRGALEYRCGEMY